MKIKLIKIEDSEIVVPLTLKVPIRLYERLKKIVETTKRKQDVARKRAAKELKQDTSVGQRKSVPRMASKQTVLLSIIEEALKDDSFEVEIESIWFFTWKQISFYFHSLTHWPQNQYRHRQTVIYGLVLSSMAF